MNRPFALISLMLLVGVALLLWWREGTRPSPPITPGNGAETPTAPAPAEGTDGQPPVRQEVATRPVDPQVSLGPDLSTMQRLLVRVRSATDGSLAAAIEGEVRVSPRYGDSIRQQLVDGQAVFEIDPATVRTVFVTAPGYMRLSRRFENEPCGAELDLSVPPAGGLRVRLVDTTGSRLTDRHVETHAVRASPLTTPSNDPMLVYLTRGGATTDATGLAWIDHAMPGTHVVRVGEFAWWREARSTEVEVTAGLTSEVTITVGMRDPATFAGVSLPLTAFPDVAEPDDMLSWRLFYGDGKSARLFVLGDRCLGMVVAEPGAEIQAFVAESEDRRQPSPGGSSSTPFVMAVGAILTVEPRWAP